LARFRREREARCAWYQKRHIYDRLTKFVLRHWYFMVEIELDLANRFEWIKIERNMTLCELHNGDVGIIYSLLNFENKSCVIVSLILI
jgi:hypothetical protein